jgi:putative heme transporter
MPDERRSMFSAPAWLRDLGFASWLLAGFVLIVFGLVWLLGQTSTIVMPVILAAVLGAVAGPIVGRLQRHRVPRAGGAAIVLLGLVLIGVLVFCLIVGGISDQSDGISAHASDAVQRIDGWLNDVDVDQSGKIKENVAHAMPGVIKTLVQGLAAGVTGLGSLMFFLAMAILSTFFVLKDGPVMHRFIDTHLGLPEHVAHTVTTNIASSLRNYFAGVTIIAGFNGVVIGGAALILGVPLAGTIAIVNFVAAYIPYLGAWTAGGFTVLLALGSQGPTDALIIGVVCLLANGALQQLIQPFVLGATLGLNPLAVLVVTIGAGSLFGMVGLTLAAPLTSAAVHISAALRSAERAPPGDAQPQPAG